MTLKHGHFAHDNKTEKLQRKSQVALAHAADCRKQLVYIDGTSGKLTNLASASVGPFPSRILIFTTVEKHLLFPGVANDHQSRICHAKYQKYSHYHADYAPCNFCGFRDFSQVLVAEDVT
jgi:hypothetical protein